MTIDIRQHGFTHDARIPVYAVMVNGIIKSTHMTRARARAWGKWVFRGEEGADFLITEV
jgi:hypothetical protein